MSVFGGAQWQGELAESDEIAPQRFRVDDLPLAEMWDDARYWLPQVMSGDRIDADVTFADDCVTVVDARVTVLPTAPAS